MWLPCRRPSIPTRLARWRDHGGATVVLLQNTPVGAAAAAAGPGRAGIAVIGPNAHRPLGQLGHYAYQVLDSMTARFAQAADPESRAAESAELAAIGPDDAELLVESVPIITFLEGIRARRRLGRRRHLRPRMSHRHRGPFRNRGGGRRRRSRGSGDRGGR